MSPGTLRHDISCRFIIIIIIDRGGVEQRHIITALGNPPTIWKFINGLRHYLYWRRSTDGLPTQGASRHRLGGPTSAISECVRFDGVEHYLASSSQGRCTYYQENVCEMWETTARTLLPTVSHQTIATLNWAVPVTFCPVLCVCDIYF